MLILLAGFAFLKLGGARIYRTASGLAQRYLKIGAPIDFSVEGLLQMASDLVGVMAYILAPLILMVLLFSILGNVVQVGLLFNLKSLQPDLSKLNFFTKFIPTFFNKEKLGSLVGSLLKLLLVGSVVALTLSGAFEEIQALSLLPLLGGIQYLLDHILAILLSVSLLLILISIGDYLWSRFTIGERMKMSKQEVKQEHEDQEGKGEIRRKRGERAQELAFGRMMQQLPTADVVVNNPTHISVALRYRAGEDIAPVVIAKGVDEIALRIRERARSVGVPMIENRALARGLYATVDLGGLIPESFFRAVAEVLAQVMQTKT